MKYEYFELCPMKFTLDDHQIYTGDKICEENEADFYTIYGRWKDGNVYLADVLADFPSKEEAQKLFDLLVFLNEKYQSLYNK